VFAWPLPWCAQRLRRRERLHRGSFHALIRLSCVSDLTNSAKAASSIFYRVTIRDSKIEIVSYLTPSSNPRVPKEAEALARVGFDVAVVSSALPGAVSIPQSGSGFFTLRSLNQRAPWWGLWRHRLIKKSAPGWPRVMRAEVAAYGSLFVDLLRFLRKPAGATLRIAHLEPSFLAAAHSGGFAPLFADFEDWYAEDLLPGSRSERLTAALRNAERAALMESSACWCTSEAMASSLSAAYGAPAPLVVRNVFPRRFRESIDGRWSDRPTMSRFATSNDPVGVRPASAPVSFHWFSQTIGPGRGLEHAFQALDGLCGGWELHLRGALGNHGPWLESVCPPGVRRRVSIHPLVSTDELTSRIAEHDVGLACEAQQPRSRDVTITNKFFQYLQAGLAVVASDTAGQREAAFAAPGAVELYHAGDPGTLRSVLQELVDNRQKLRIARGVAWEAGGRLCWENEAPTLVEAVEKALDRRSPTI
jgi:hypothetical protein